MCIAWLLQSCGQPTEVSNLLEREISDNWNYKQVDGELSGKAIVPGTIHTDLLANKQIEDPFYRTIEKNLQWIDKEDWVYSCQFEITENEFQKSNIVLDFKGLDTYADITLNGKPLLKADNMFREWEINIKDNALIGTNELVVYFHSPISKGLELLDKAGMPFPASNDQSENGGLGNKKVSVFTRKAGYHYGWDWGPRFVTSGIWRPVFLKAWDSAIIKDVFIKQPEVNKSKASLIASVTLLANEDTKGKIELYNTATGKRIKSKSVNIVAGQSTFDLSFSINNPKLWWSNGLGEPNLYDFQTILIIDDKIIAKNNVKVGIRDIQLIREKDEFGESFYFKLNGVKVFAKGANYIPNDSFLPRVTKNDYEKVIDDAVNANMNMLRVWGGGIYEDDYFYELCDQKGIMVWQDFMFACSMYPGDKDFLDNVKQEAIDNVKRIRNHPSIVLWCGNNEINTAWNYGAQGGWGWKERYDFDQQVKLQDAYMQIFHDILPDVIQNYTDGDDYWPSSPQAGYDVMDHASYDTKSGDMHYWGVWHGLHSFESFIKYKARFMSEYGFQSFPDMETVDQYTLPEDYDIESEVMSAHQRSGIGNLRIAEYLYEYFDMPTNFADILYMSQVLQAYGMQIGMEAHRRAMPYCMGSLYWQINDCWPVASWSSTDYYHKWKAMHYATKQAFEKTIISTEQHGDTLKIYGITDELDNIKGILKLQLLNLEGSVLKEEKINTSLLANTSTLLLQTVEYNQKVDTSTNFLNIKLIANDSIVAENNVFFTKPKGLILQKPEIKYNFEEKDDKLYINIQSDKLARYVYLNVPNKTEFFLENYFDLLPNQIKTIQVEGITKDEAIDLEIKHLQQIKNPYIRITRQ